MRNRPLNGSFAWRLRSAHNLSRRRRPAARRTRLRAGGDGYPGALPRVPDPASQGDQERTRVSKRRSILTVLTALVTLAALVAPVHATGFDDRADSDDRYTLAVVGDMP